MNARELRIGNWVYPNDENATPWEVSGALENAVFFLSREGFNISTTVDASNLEPIPLTEEWLEKFGFLSETIMRKDVYSDKQMPHHQFKIEGFDSDIILQDHINSFERNILEKGKLGQHGWYVTTDKLIGSGGLAICHYVHQLQNLYFALTGEELALS